MLPNDKVIIANPMVVCREEFDDWAILFDLETGKAFGINPVAVLIWKMLDGKHGLEDISRDIKANFMDVPEDVKSHIESFLKDLIEIGFVGYEV
jgi:SynChlorMet cassette protein ScmD